MPTRRTHEKLPHYYYYYYYYIIIHIIYISTYLQINSYKVLEHRDIQNILKPFPIPLNLTLPFPPPTIVHQKHIRKKNRIYSNWLKTINDQSQKLCVSVNSSEKFQDIGTFPDITNRVRYNKTRSINIGAAEQYVSFISKSSACRAESFVTKLSTPPTCFYR